MLSKSILKYIQSLHHKKFRDQHNLFIAEGAKVIIDLLLSAQFECKLLCAVDSFLINNEKLLSAIEETSKQQVSEAELQKISLLQTPNKVVGLFYKTQPKEIVLQKNLSLMLDDIRDPGNMGTLMRIADWFGISNIICSKDCVDHYNPKVVQASMGSISRVNVTYTHLEQFIDENREISVYAATLDGKPVHSFNKITEGLILMGNESRGIKNELIQLAKHQVTIPRYGGGESLNAAVAAGIILSHMVK